MLPANAEELLPALAPMQQQPAWAAIMAGHQPQDWPQGVPPPQRHQHLTCLAAQKVLPDEAVQAVQSFYFFLLVSPSASASLFDTVH